MRNSLLKAGNLYVSSQRTTANSIKEKLSKFRYGLQQRRLSTITSTGIYNNNLRGVNSPVHTEKRNMADSGRGSAFHKAETDNFMKELFTIIHQDALVKGTDRKTKVIDFVHPADLEKKMEMEVGADGIGDKKFLELCKKAVQYSVQTGHAGFYNQLYSGRDLYGTAAALLMEALNTNEHTFEVAPVFTMAENYVFKKMVKILGYKQGDGIFLPGGSMANLMALNLARYKHNKELKEKGLFGSKRLDIFTSESSHYSTKKGAAFMGFGTDSVIPIKTDDTGKMLPEDLELKVKESIKNGAVPLAVVATSGTTVLGAYDPLNPIADICEKYKMWFHVDAAWGGGVIHSAKHRHLMKGIERTDSILYNFHKMLAAPLQSTAFVTSHNSLLKECNGLGATYLFQQDKFYDVSFDTGDKTIQCGRKGDAYKVWMMWKGHGDKGFEAIVDRAFDNAKYFTEKIKATDGFRLVQPEFECTNICFWYIPASLRGQEETEEWKQKLHKVAPAIKEGMTKDGTMLIGYNPLGEKGHVNFFRIIISNQILDHKDMDFVVEEIERLGKNL